ncbi:conserved hypothetical protein [Sphingomonas sp. T1]|uniref:DUF2946 family protein n=1 Tax=Sphingomonas sp. T1 TaxID=2653172 RepID=UPI0012F2D898|nr:DUF2946 family protein [Sphingomonas sp. T1]VXD02574.1 conserved hypothetical protein [Sphingomonas sp. T1]
MTPLRRLLRDHPALAAWLVVVALAMKILVPGGFMPVVANGVLTIQLCAGAGPVSAATPVPVHAAMPGMTHDPDKTQHAGREMPCAFSGLTTAGLAAADPVLLALAIAFVVATVFRAATPVVARAPEFLRPPLRGPPVRG